ncbi:MAG: endonuclease V [Bacteroidota bacterium]
MILAVDVHYRKEFAKVVAVEFNKWTDRIPARISEEIVENVEEYISGEFYKRELPCILEILKKTDQSNLDVIIVDGYVQLNDNGKAGLGKYLYESLNQEIPVIGVAKRGFKGNMKYVVEVHRGKSKNPLYITSVGIDLHESAAKIKNMFGKYRMPDLLRILDQKTKES